MARSRAAPIPITVVAGVRGAGKTTLINRLLGHPEFANTAVILNDFGAVELSGGLVERAEDGFLELGSGCVCCSVRGALTDGLEKLLRDLDNGRAVVGRVVIEADEAADPAAILAAVERHPYLALRFAADSVVTVVAAASVGTTVGARADAVRQIAMADVIAVAWFEDADAARPVLRALNPIAPIVDAATVDPAVLVGHGAVDPAIDDLEDWLTLPESSRRPALAGEAARIHAFSVARDRIMSFARLDRFVEYLAMLQAPNLIRVRGVVASAADETVVVDGIGGFFRPPLIVDRATTPAIRFSVVARDLDPATFEGYLDAFLGEARVDAPDAAALTESPLALGGFSARSGK